MNVSPIKGHALQQQWLRRAIERGRLAHAFLFAGPAGIGKRRVAELLIRSLFCETADPSELAPCGNCAACKQLRAGTHPDYHTVGIPEGKREIPIKDIAGEDDRRGQEGLCHDLSLRPMSAGRKAAVIDDAHAMNQASANSLLKTLEEPPAGALIVLVTDQPGAMLPTIRSRCQLVQFQPLTVTEVAEILVEGDLVGDAGEAERLAAVSGGSVQTALTLRDGPLRQYADLVEQRFSSARLNPLEVSREVLSAFDEFPAAEQRQHAGWLLRYLAEFYRRSLRCAGETDGDSTPASRFAAELGESSEAQTDVLTGLLERVHEAELHLAEAMGLPLCIESLVDELARVQRAAVVEHRRSNVQR